MSTFGCLYKSLRDLNENFTNLAETCKNPSRPIHFIKIKIIKKNKKRYENQGILLLSLIEKNVDVLILKQRDIKKREKIEKNKREREREMDRLIDK